MLLYQGIELTENCIKGLMLVFTNLERIFPGDCKDNVDKSVGKLGSALVNQAIARDCVAGSTGLEPAASGVTGRRSDQLNYDPGIREKWWAIQGLNL